MKNNEKRRRQNKAPSQGNPEKLDSGDQETRSERGYSRPPLARMVRIHDWLMANRYPNCRKIAEEFEVSPKTVQRDINFMRDQMGLPIDYDKARFGFHYTRPVIGFPAMALAEGKPRTSPWRQTPPPALGVPPQLSASDHRGSVQVRIRFDSEVAAAVRRRIWHPTQVIRSLPGGGIEISMRARDEGEIARWVLSWAGRASVIEPLRLRQRVRQLAREIAARH
jgi:predicted DNA-binding transcriptional regulator YafY